MKKINHYLSYKWEYLPSYLLHLPTAFFYLFFSLKSRSLLFFTNISNDYKSSDIENSSKQRVYEQLDKQFYPTTVLVRREELSQIELIDLSTTYGLNYPVIIKPNIGKRGLGAVLINNHGELVNHCKEVQYDILLQEYVDSMNECGIFYIRYPHEEKATITSIGLKKLPAIIGDGHSTLHELLVQSSIPEGICSKIAERYDVHQKVLDYGESKVVEPIGAHNRGARISAANHLITDDLLSVIEKSILGLNLYYGRLDVKFDTWPELLAGKFKIIEVNTITSEPLSIYDPRIPISKKYRIIYAHMKSMYEISSILKSMGQPILNVRIFLNYIFNYRAHLKQISEAKV